MSKMRIAINTILLLLGLALCACAGGSVLGDGQPAAPVLDSGLRDTLAQLDAMPTPIGADARTFAMLKSKFRAMLIARQASKSSSTAPTSNRSVVNDLGIWPDAGVVRFAWTYRNEGDYNQNGVVGVTDLSVLGINFGKSSASADWTTARAADGNGDGQINAGDLTSIGIGFGNTVTGYSLEYSFLTGWLANWTRLDSVQFLHSSITASGLRRFDCVESAPPSGYYYRVVPCDTDISGIPGDPVEWGANRPGDWSMFGRNAQHTRRSPYAGPSTNALKWSYTTGGAVGSPVIGGDGTVYVGSGDSKLYAINSDGSLKWAINSDGPSDPAVGLDGTVYVGCMDAKLHAINPDGSIKWTYATGYLAASPPAIGADATVYVGSRDDKLYAINPDGSLKWSYTTGDEVLSSPAIGTDGTIYVGSMDNNLYAINADGSLKWTNPTADWVISSPAIGADGTVYVGSMDANLYAVKPDGKLKWAYPTPTGGGFWSSPAIGADGTVYIGCLDGSLYAMNPNGTRKWSGNTLERIFSSPAVGANGMVYFGNYGNSVFGSTPDNTGAWYYITGGAVASSPAIGADGTVYIGCNDNNLYAFGPGGV